MLSKELQIISTVAICIISSSCTLDYDVESALNSAGANRRNLESVLEHYRKVDSNPQKLLAAEYLIANMPGHYSYADSSIHEYEKARAP